MLRDHQTIYEPPALPSRLQAEFGEPHFGKQPTQPEDARRPACPPLATSATIASEGVQEGCDGASARAPVEVEDERRGVAVLGAAKAAMKEARRRRLA